MDGPKELHPTPEFQDECDTEEIPSKSHPFRCGSPQAISSDQAPSGRPPAFQLLFIGASHLESAIQRIEIVDRVP
jgi:hypothetical protein